MSLLKNRIIYYSRQTMSQPAQSKKKAISPIQNIKVVVRVRPLNNEEKERRVKTVVHCVSNREIQTRDKKYQFDRVFQPDSSQMDIYLFVVAPMISDILAGYNCTVFAYGQTGTGKTHTMTGGDPTMSSSVHWKEDALAGCIPRTAANIFDEIGSMEVVDYNVRVSFLELYNEEVRDLLSEDERPPPLNIFNDSKGSVYIQSLNEITVFNSNDIYMLLQKGTCKRQTASTLMNNHSSRSHTVFTITVHTREANITGEEVLKTGKINLVDLAGSENIAKSGAKDKRAQELANINRSLLTLGRVIQILAEKNNKHVPYRDSKLTRILQDSLGGHTKTCIIATVSPSHTSYEETQSTLEYACRARDIRNTPMINEKVTKAQMMKEMTNEIEKLKRDLDAARSGDGFFIDRMNWEELHLQLQSSSNALTLKNEVIDEMKKKLADLEVIQEMKLKEFEQVMNVCQKKERLIEKAKALLKKQKVSLKQEQYVSKCYAKAATENSIKAKELLETTKKLSSNQEILQKKLENQYFNNYTNEQIIKEKSVKINDILSLTMGEIENSKNATIISINNHKIDINSAKKYCKDLTHVIHSTIEKEKKPVLESLFEKQSNLLTGCTKNVASAIEESQQEVAKMLGLANNGLSACTDITDNFEKFDESTSSKMAAMTNLLTTVQLELSKQRQKEEVVLQELEKFTNITKNRITGLDCVISKIESSKQLWQNSEQSAQDNERRNNIKTKLNDAQDNYKLIQVGLEDKERCLESQKQSCIDSERNLLSCAQELRENVFEGLSYSLDTVQGFSRTLCSKLDTLEEKSSLLEKSVENDLKNFSSSLKKANENNDIVENIIPVKREGDTPKQNNINYPKRIGEGALPRDVLIKRFKEEFNEDIENESFHLNVSADSVQPLDESDEEKNGSEEVLECSNLNTPILT